MKLAIIKTIITVLSNRKFKKGIGTVVAIILSPIIIIIVVFSALFSTGANHNNEMVMLAFNNAPLSINMEEKYREQIEKMREHFIEIDKEIEEVNKNMEDDKSLDSIRIKAFFYTLTYENIIIDYKKFVDCFVIYETKQKEVTDKMGNVETITYKIAKPIKNLVRIYENIQYIVNKNITDKMILNANEIYHIVKYGKTLPSNNKEFDNFINTLPSVNENSLISINGFISPIGNDWRNYVTSEFGDRVDPFDKIIKGHGALDIAKPKGTPIYAALGGVVKLARNTNNGYGKHIIIDHGSDFITLYGHCSKLNVVEGQAIKVGEKIGEVGSTGRSTGNHLHFEIRKNGEKQNPRNYLP